MTNVIELNDDNFDEVLRSSDKPIVVDFFAPWCGHCRNQAPIFEEFAKEISDRAVVAKINVDENRIKASEYFITGIPAILVFKNGEKLEQKSGLQRKEQLSMLVEKYSNN